MAKRSRRQRFSSLRTFDSLRDRRYRAYFLAMLGQMSSQSMQMVVRGFIAFQLTGSYAALGLISLANAIPGLALVFIGGAVADRIPYRKWVVQAGQAVNAVASLAISILAFAGVLEFEHLFITAVMQGTAMAFSQPARQALLPSLVAPNQVTNAVALNAAGMNTMRLIAPAAGGFLLAYGGAGWVYFLMTGLYALACVFMTRVPEARRDVARSAGVKGEAKAAYTNIKDGCRYIFRHSILGPLLVLNICMVITAMPYQFLLAGFVQDVLNEGADSVGILQGVTGVGALVGALTIASVQWRHRGRMYLIGAGFQGLMLLLAFSLSTSVWMMAAFLLAMGLGQSARQSLSNVLVQSHVDDEFRGRVMSVYMLQFSLSQFGAFITGALAEAFGPRVALAGTSTVLILLSVSAFIFLPRIRQLA